MSKQLACLHCSIRPMRRILFCSVQCWVPPVDRRAPCHQRMRADQERRLAQTFGPSPAERLGPLVSTQPSPGGRVAPSQASASTRGAAFPLLTPFLLHSYLLHLMFVGLFVSPDRGGGWASKGRCFESSLCLFSPASPKPCIGLQGVLAFVPGPRLDPWNYFCFTRRMPLVIPP